MEGQEFKENSHSVIMLSEEKQNTQCYLQNKELIFSLSDYSQRNAWKSHQNLNKNQFKGVDS